MCFFWLCRTQNRNQEILLRFRRLGKEKEEIL